MSKMVFIWPWAYNYRFQLGLHNMLRVLKQKELQVVEC